MHMHLHVHVQMNMQINHGRLTWVPCKKVALFTSQRDNLKSLKGKNPQTCRPSSDSP